MLFFLVPFLAKSASKNFDVAVANLQNTIRSLDNQICRDFRILLVHHDAPNLKNAPDTLISVAAPFGPAVVHDHSAADLHFKQIDKIKKIALGTKVAVQQGATHIMVMDADDFVSNTLAGIVFRNNTASGWYLKNGFNSAKVLGYRILSKRPDFHQHCGSSYIIRADLMPKFDGDLIESEREIWESEMRLFIFHGELLGHLQSLGVSLEAIEHPSAIYYRNDESMFSADYEKSIRWDLKKNSVRVFRYVRVSERIRREFMFSA